ncbi:MAG: DUF4339 domain-containing protein [Verrucomicrobiales bacterium]
MTEHQNRYRYLTETGEPRGPAWLAEMRRLYQSGEIGPETQVCRENDEDWGPARTFPEITSENAILPDPPRPDRKARSEGVSWGVWALIILVALFMAWVQFFYLKQ